MLIIYAIYILLRINTSMSQIKHCKVVFVGESGVGKTSIISCFVESEFVVPQNKTTEAVFNTKTLTLNSNNQSLSFELWDTTGQTSLRSMAKLFYANADVIVLVYNVTSLSTFTEIKNYWLDQIEENAHEEMRLVLVGNFSDKASKAEVSEEQGKQLAKELNAQFKLISAKSYDDVVELFQEIGNVYYTQCYEGHGLHHHRTKEKNASSLKIKGNDNDYEKYGGSMTSSYNNQC